MTRAVILVPRRDDGGYRDELWTWTRAWWEREQSHMPIVEGYHTDGLFNRSAAINNAARIAGDWDVAVIIDADVICDPGRVKQAVEIAASNGTMVLPHTVRLDLSRRGAELVRNRMVDPFGLPETRSRHVHHIYSVENGHPSVSSVVVVPRALWDLVGGFDEEFRGWGYEDTAFAAACETFGGVERMPGAVIHLWHPTAREGKRGTPTHSLNSARGQAYRAAIGDKYAIRALQNSSRAKVYADRPSRIPRILHRVVPEKPNATADGWWARFEELHPDWQLITHRDPLHPQEWPRTREHWKKAANGAQFADMIRLEALYRYGGIYVDQDVEPLRSLEPLLYCSAFAAWEDERSIPNAVMGSTPRHPAIKACLDEMLTRLPGDTWKAGPGVLTDILPGRPDVLLLPPGTFFPVHYADPDRDLKLNPGAMDCPPWTFAVHHYWGSWLPEERRRVPA